MKKIILQHWNGNLRDLEKLSVASMTAYADYVGADYKLLTGHPFDKRYSDQLQKLAMLNKEFDDYDYTLMVDTDMVCVKGLKEDVFELPGIGMHTDYQTSIFKNFQKKFPKLSDNRYAYWGGAIYKMSQSLRHELRSHISHQDLAHSLGGKFHDEFYTHRLAMLAELPLEDEPIPQRWCYCSYRPNPEKAAMIHVRPKIKLGEKAKRSKIENYQMLKKQGVF
jgi:hypothetical protein